MKDCATEVNINKQGNDGGQRDDLKFDLERIVR